MPKLMKTMNLAIILKIVRRLKIDLDQNIISEQDSFPFGKKWHVPAESVVAVVPSATFIGYERE